MRSSERPSVVKSAVSERFEHTISAVSVLSRATLMCSLVSGGILLCFGGDLLDCMVAAALPIAVSGVLLLPVFLLVGGGVDLGRAAHRALEQRRVLMTRRQDRAAGQVSVAEPRAGDLSIRLKSKTSCDPP